MKTRTNFRSFQYTLNIAIILLVLVSQFGWAVGKAFALGIPSGKFTRVSVNSSGEDVR